MIVGVGVGVGVDVNSGGLDVIEAVIEDMITQVFEDVDKKYRISVDFYNKIEGVGMSVIEEIIPFMERVYMYLKLLFCVHFFTELKRIFRK